MSADYRRRTALCRVRQNIRQISYKNDICVYVNVGRTRCSLLRMSDAILVQTRKHNGQAELGRLFFSFPSAICHLHPTSRLLSKGPRPCQWLGHSRTYLFLSLTFSLFFSFFFFFFLLFLFYKVPPFGPPSTLRVETLPTTQRNGSVSGRGSARAQLRKGGPGHHFLVFCCVLFQSPFCILPLCRFISSVWPAHGRILSSLRSLALAFVFLSLASVRLCQLSE